eukprot:6339826-Pyramimonas_sp.AAC.1
MTRRAMRQELLMALRRGVRASSGPRAILFGGARGCAEESAGDGLWHFRACPNLARCRVGIFPRDGLLAS